MHFMNNYDIFIKKKKKREKYWILINMYICRFIIYIYIMLEQNYTTEKIYQIVLKKIEKYLTTKKKITKS